LARGYRASFMSARLVTKYHVRQPDERGQAAGWACRKVHHVVDCLADHHQPGFPGDPRPAPVGRPGSARTVGWPRPAAPPP
jgi:hypothetical protein